MQKFHQLDIQKKLRTCNEGIDLGKQTTLRLVRGWPDKEKCTDLAVLWQEDFWKRSFSSNTVGS